MSANGRHYRHYIKRCNQNPLKGRMAKYTMFLPRGPRSYRVPPNSSEAELRAAFNAANARYHALRAPGRYARPPVLAIMPLAPEQKRYEPIIEEVLDQKHMDIDDGACHPPQQPQTAYGRHKHR